MYVSNKIYYFIFIIKTKNKSNKNVKLVGYSTFYGINALMSSSMEAVVILHEFSRCSLVIF